MTCILCYRDERFHHKGKRKFYTTDTGVPLVCAGCIQKLLQVSHEELGEAISKAEASDFLEKAVVLKSLMEEENVPKARKARSNMVGKRPVRSARPARDQLRA